MKIHQFISYAFLENIYVFIHHVYSNDKNPSKNSDQSNLGGTQTVFIKVCLCIRRIKNIRVHIYMGIRGYLHLLEHGQTDRRDKPVALLVL